MEEHVALVIAAMMSRLGLKEVTLTRDELELAHGARVTAFQDLTLGGLRVKVEPKPVTISGGAR